MPQFLLLRRLHLVESALLMSCALVPTHPLLRQFRWLPRSRFLRKACLIPWHPGLVAGLPLSSLAAILPILTLSAIIVFLVLDRRRRTREQAALNPLRARERGL